MTQHPLIPHVSYLFERSARTFGRLVIHMSCAACRQKLDWNCTGAPGMPEWRVNQFALLHLHGYPAFANPMPRGIKR